MKKITPTAVLAPESALRSRPRVAVSSPQSKKILGRTERICMGMNENELFHQVLKAGKITFADLIDESGRPISLTKLKEMG